MNATVTINLPKDREVDDVEYTAPDANGIFEQILKDYPKAESVVIVVCFP